MTQLVDTVRHIRQARPSDWPTVKPFCDDYVRVMWDAWLADGGLLTFGDDGICHHSVTQYEAWIEGVRVRPSARRSGVGSALVAKAERLAGRLGARQARAAINTTNQPTLRMFAKMGYHGEWDWHAYTCRTTARVCGCVRAAPARMLPARYVNLWRWVPTDAAVDQAVYTGGGSVAMLADSTYPDVMTVTVSHDGEPRRDDAFDLVDYAADKAYWANKRLEVFSTHRLDHPGLAAPYTIRVMLKEL